MHYFSGKGCSESLESMHYCIGILNLTLKAKGLLSLMLSLPDDWNYNMQGLATLSRDGLDSVRSAIKELEHHGYVERHRLRNEYGFYGDTEYIIREVPLGEEND